ncbi:hypothetical protein ACFE04_025681 [Oxalis oulophora]
MKMLQTSEPMITRDDDSGTVLVGVKLDSLSRELLTWALVKVAQPGDTVIALHVLATNDIVDRDGKSSLLSLVKAFDSVLAVYEGFCNLKQVDLKLKICRGSSIEKILIREAISNSAAKVIVGASKTHHTIRSSTSVAKYLAKKLPKDCGVLAVNNGKIVIQKTGSSKTSNDSEEAKHHRRHSFLGVIQKSITLSKNSKVLSESEANIIPKDTNNNYKLEQALVKSGLNHSGSLKKYSCSICGPTPLFMDNSSDKFSEDNSQDGGHEETSMAMVQVQKAQQHSRSLSLSKGFSEVRPGWPLLRTARQIPDRSLVKQISVVQWAMRLPSRHLSSFSSAGHKENSFSFRPSSLDGVSGAIVPLCIDTLPNTHFSNYESRIVPRELEGLHEKYSAICRLFKYGELLSATSNFAAENLIGKGGSSQVFRGCLPDGKELAVKILNQSDDILKEFVLEIEIITKLHHKNIISLLGFCFEDNILLLVYDLLSRGSLDENLHGDKKDPTAFGWHKRHKVALGVAEALDYLHSRSDKPVIHRDVKSSNILLSDDFEPQLSDFGLAKWASNSSKPITCTDVAGTFGYLAPEYFMYGKVNNKIDVYAFGVVLLELLTGRKPISNDFPKGQESLVLWAKPILSGGKISQLLDPILGDNYDSDQIERMVLAAALCIRRTPRARPQMSLILKLLSGDVDVTKWAKLQLNDVEESDMPDDEESCQRSNLQSHLNVALLDMEDDSLSLSSIEQSISLEDYLQGRWSRSSSFD